MIKTDFEELDNLFGENNKGQFIVLASRPKVGKTSFALNIVRKVIKDGIKCAYFSLNEKKEMIEQRLLCQIADVSLNKKINNELNENEEKKVMASKNELNNTDLVIDDESLSMEDIITKSQKIHKEKGLDCVVIDSVQLLCNDTERNGSKQKEYTQISKQINNLIASLGITVILLSQLSSNSDTLQKTPRLKDLYTHADALLQEADIIVFLHKPYLFSASNQNGEEYIESITEFWVEKNRYGEIGMVEALCIDGRPLF